MFLEFVLDRGELNLLETHLPGTQEWFQLYARSTSVINYCQQQLIINICVFFVDYFKVTEPVGRGRVERSVERAELGMGQPGGTGQAASQCQGPQPGGVLVRKLFPTRDTQCHVISVACHGIAVLTSL